MRSQIICGEIQKQIGGDRESNKKAARNLTGADGLSQGEKILKVNADDIIVHGDIEGLAIRHAELRKMLSVSFEIFGIIAKRRDRQSAAVKEMEKEAAETANCNGNGPAQEDAGSEPEKAKMTSNEQKGRGLKNETDTDVTPITVTITANQLIAKVKIQIGRADDLRDVRVKNLTTGVAKIVDRGLDQTKPVGGALPDHAVIK